jgi:hypothetical protein
MVACCLIYALYPIQSHSQPTATATPALQTLTFKMVNDAGQGGVELANARQPLDPEKWRTVVSGIVREIRLSDGTVFPETCSATLIGPNVVLTAAHCFDRGDSLTMNGTISLKVGPQMLSVKCTVSDQYAKAVREKMHGDRRPRVPEDYALCSFSSEN